MKSFQNPPREKSKLVFLCLVAVKSIKAYEIADMAYSLYWKELGQKVICLPDRYREKGAI